MKSIIIGSVKSSEIVLQALIDQSFPIAMVFSLDEEYAKNVSGYCPIHKKAHECGLPYTTFHKINDDENYEIIREIQPDYIFVIGISQMVSQRIIDCARCGVVGFHPTPLPKYRGRAAMVWQVLLDVHESKCSMFLIDEGMDSGDILGQEPFIIEDTDYAIDVGRKVDAALGILSRRVVKQLLDGTATPEKQDEELATYLLIRRPEDGLINWTLPVKQVQRLIRAVSKPYPGAFSLYDGNHKIIIWRADYLPNTKYIGLPGQICEVHHDYFDIVGIDGLIRVTEHENVDNVKLLVGHKLKQ